MKLEKPTIHWNALDVLAHQIVGITFENDNLTIEKAWKIIKRSYVYKDLTFEKFIEVLNFLNEIKLIRLDGNIIKRTRKGMFYYYENLSMIPDEKSYIVIDIATNRKIGILHEEFVAKHGNKGTIFILRGLPWKIEEISGNKVYVILEKDFESAIPSWEGELIPVPYEVAQEATRLKAKDLEKFEELKTQKLYFMPDPNKIFIEQYKDWIIIHSPCGTKVNDTLSRILAYNIAITEGVVVGIKTDPYRILLRSYSLNKETIKEVLLSLDPESVEKDLISSIKYTNLFLWKFVHVAKRFGVIRKDADYSKSTIRRIAERLENTPVFEETIRELLTDKFDIEKTREIVEKIKTGEIKVEIINRTDVSPLAKLALTEVVSDVMLTREKWREIMELVKERLLNTKLVFFCLNCYNYFVETVKDSRNRCPVCGSEYLSVAKEREIERIEKLSKKLKKKRELNKQEVKLLNYLYKTADLYKNYGKRFLMVYAGKGISLPTALNILKKDIKDEEELIKEIVEYEKRFLRIKRFI